MVEVLHECERDTRAEANHCQSISSTQLHVPLLSHSRQT